MLGLQLNLVVGLSEQNVCSAATVNKDLTDVVVGHRGDDHQRILVRERNPPAVGGCERHVRHRRLGRLNVSVVHLVSQSSKVTLVLPPRVYSSRDNIDRREFPLRFFTVFPGEIKVLPRVLC